MSPELFTPGLKSSLRQWLVSRRWFGGKARAIFRIETVDLIPLRVRSGGLMLLRVDYTVGPPELYLLMFVLLDGEDAERAANERPAAIVHRFERSPGQPPFLMVDALADSDFARGLLDIVAEQKSLSGPRDLPPVLQGLMRQGGTLSASCDSRLAEIMAAGPAAFVPDAGEVDQSNSCVVYGRRLFLKLFRRLEQGVNPELEIGRFLAQQTDFAHMPPLLGALEYRPPHGEPMSVGVLQGFVAGRSAWQFTLDHLADYFKLLAQQPREGWPTPRSAFAGPAQERQPWALSAIAPAAYAEELTGEYLSHVGLLGQRTAELHLALGGDSDQPEFSPEPFSDKYQQGLRWSMRDLAARTCELLRQRLALLPAAVQPTAREVLSAEPRMLARFDELAAGPIGAQRIRCHGDYHLGQVLWTDGDFTIIDFEGEPARSLAERRAKRSPLVDVAGMVRSLHYAASQALFQQLREQPEQAAALRGAADAWYLWTIAAFVRGYRQTASAGRFLPRAAADCERLLSLFMLEKAVYELAYELNNRPEWVEVPLRGLSGLLR